ncbi:MAG: hypothetical protein O3A59_12775 [Nitrospirae bacterium]|nr:hypothetical protein [Nitrospirota bacterium]
MNQTKLSHRGGKRPGAGRKKSALTIRTRAMAEELIASGVSPLEFVINLMRESKPKRLKNETLAAYESRVIAWRTQTFDAARAALPYIHPRLAAVEHSGQDGESIPHSIEVVFI